MRQCHFVGTIGCSGAREAMGLMLDTAYPKLTTIPDGESGDRADWITSEIESRARLPELMTLRRSRMRTHDPLRPLLHPPIYAKRPGATMPVAELNTGYAANAAIASGILAALARERGNTSPPALQVDIPGPLDLAAFSWGPGIKRNYKYEVASLLREIEQIHRRIPTAVFQLSIPFETHLIAHTPKTAARLMAGLCKFVAATPPGCAFVVHFCLGDPHGKPITRIHSAETLAHATNELYYHWPHSTHVLDGVHLPFGDGVHPAPHSASYYWALRSLAIPPEVRLIAGIAQVMERAPLDRQLATLKTIELSAHREVVISSPCGWGRRAHLVPELCARTLALACAPPSSLWTT